jgi:hypothetical protein
MYRDDFPRELLFLQVIDPLIHARHDSDQLSDLQFHADQLLFAFLHTSSSFPSVMSNDAAGAAPPHHVGQDQSAYAASIASR